MKWADGKIRCCWANPRNERYICLLYTSMCIRDSSWGTAVNVQMMAFGNMGETSGTGVAFTRDPATGEKHLMGEFLMNAQGEDCLLYTSIPISEHFVS